jgi:predicted component of type VI protein secretion system
MVQLTDAQRRELKRLARERHVSVSELVRRGVDMVLSCEVTGPDARRRAREAVGFADFGIKDLADRHDEYFAEALRQ